MPRRRSDTPRYVRIWTDHTGKRRSAYQRTDPRGRKRIVISLPTPIYSPEWSAAYERIHATFERDARRADQDARAQCDRLDSFAMVAASYVERGSFVHRRASTRAAYLIEVERLKRTFGDAPIATLDRRTIVELRDKVAETKPGVVSKMLAVLTKIMEHAQDRGLIETNPAKGVGMVPGYEATPHRHWEPEEIELFLAKAPPHLRRMAIVLLHTGLRVSDAVRLERRHLDDGYIEIKTAKTGADVCIPISRPLAEELARPRPVESFWLITGARGAPYRSANAMSQALSEFWQRLGIKGHPSAHGLRRNAVMSLVEMGLDVPVIQAITGQSPQIIAYYAARYRRRAVVAQVKAKFDQTDG